MNGPEASLFSMVLQEFYTEFQGPVRVLQNLSELERVPEGVLQEGV